MQNGAPPLIVDDLHALTRAELSRRPRFLYVGVLLGSAAMTAVTGTLLVTEPSMPARTRAAFLVLSLIGLSWVAFCSWALTHRRPLLGRDRVIAGRMAACFCAIFTAGALAMTAGGGGRTAISAAGLGLVMLAVAVILLRRAAADVRRLSARRDRLAQELQGEAR